MIIEEDLKTTQLVVIASSEIQIKSGVKGK
jgi:hypothetical protein